MSHRHPDAAEATRTGDIHITPAPPSFLDRLLRWGCLLLILPILIFGSIMAGGVFVSFAAADRLEDEQQEQVDATSGPSQTEGGEEE